MDNHGGSKIPVIVAIATLLILVFIGGLVLYQHRGETVVEEERAFSSNKAHFEFALSAMDAEHRLFLAVRHHYTDDYQYKLKVRLIFPSGKELEKEILKLEHAVDFSANTTETTHHTLWKFPAEKGRYDLNLSIHDKNGEVTVKKVKVTVKRL